VTLVDRGSDSTGTAGADSLFFLLRRVPEAWEGGVDDLGAARLTAQAVRQDLGRRDPAEWPRRAKYLLDSLSVGVEIGGEPCGWCSTCSCVPPRRGSWPFLIWCRDDPTAPRRASWRAADRPDRRAHPAHGDRSGRRPVRGGDQVAGCSRTCGPPEPMLFVWSRTGDQWKIVQTLGADSLGGFGEGRFELRAGRSTWWCTWRARAGFDGA
jgi:hypothetical protein